MRIILANPRGFCAGVQMAIDVVDQVLRTCPGQPLYVYHEIVHNKHVVQRFVGRGVTFVESIDEVPEGSIVVFSAHGVSPEVRRQADARRLRSIDATCPLVTKVHSEAVRYARQGYEILLVGHADHQEVVGTRGEAPESIRVIETAEDAASVRVRDPSRVAYLTQTTLSTDDAGKIIHALRAAIPSIKEPPSSDICYATTNRQAAVREIAPECDLVLVIGSRNSSNSKRLTEISQNVGTPAYLIDDVREMKDEWFETLAARPHAGTVLVTAGASAPEDLVAEVCRTLVSRYGGVVEQRDVFKEEVEFGLPLSLKRLMREHDVEPTSDRIRVGEYHLTEDAYGAVAITVEGRGIRR